MKTCSNLESCPATVLLIFGIWCSFCLGQLGHGPNGSDGIYELAPLHEGGHIASEVLIRKLCLRMPIGHDMRMEEEFLLATLKPSQVPCLSCSDFPPCCSFSSAFKIQRELPPIRFPTHSVMFGRRFDITFQRSASCTSFLCRVKSNSSDTFADCFHAACCFQLT